jgi:hypothetical protein
MNKEKKNILKEECNIDIFLCIIYSIIIGLYFISLNFINMLSTQEIYELYTKISYTVFIIVAIIIFEVAYKKDNGITAIYGIEFMVLAIHILLIERITRAFEFNISNYILTTSYIWPIYYCLKAVIIHTKENRRRLRQISDISEIVKEEKPTKKVAKKRKS